MKKMSIIFILFIIILVACNNATPTNISEFDNGMTASVESSPKEETAVTMQSSVAESLPTLQQLNDEKSALEERILNDLYSRIELIPFSGFLGGMPSIYNARILNPDSLNEWRLSGYVFASADDGHVDGDFIYYFTIDENDDIHWQLISGDMLGKAKVYEESFITGRQRILILTDTLSYDPATGLLQFTIPDIPQESLLYLRIYTDFETSADPISVFGQETENFRWQPGQTYTHRFEPYTLQEMHISIGFVPITEKTEDIVLDYLSFSTGVTIDKDGIVDVTFYG